MQCRRFRDGGNPGCAFIRRGISVADGSFGKDCVAVKDYKRYKVGDFGNAKGMEQMKAEIFARGPISCYVDVTQEFLDYQGGIFEMHDMEVLGGHIIEIAGWDSQGGT